MLTIDGHPYVPWKRTLTPRDVLRKFGYNESVYSIAVNGQLIRQKEYRVYKIPSEATVIIFRLAQGG